MIRSTILFLISLGSTVLVDGQDLIFRGIICNRSTKEPIPYATVQKANSRIFKDADERGQFEISMGASDSLIVTSIGFSTVKLAISPSGKIDTILLQQSTTNSPEIIVSKPTIETYGILNAKKDRTCVGGLETTRYEVATLIEIPESVGFYRISKIIVKGKDFSNENPIRMHLYAVDSNGLPGKELLTRDIVVVTSEDKKNQNIIDVKDQNIFVEDKSFFVGFQWLGTKKQRSYIGPELYETLKVDKLLTFRRNLGRNNDTWYGWYDKMIVFFPGGVVPDKAVPINVLASAEIEVFEKSN